MLDPLQVAQYFIIRAYQDGREADMTNMKVQKLLYYTQCLHLALFDEPLITDEIQAWRYGPVCPPAYGYYSEFEATFDASVSRAVVSDPLAFSPLRITPPPPPLPGTPKPRAVRRLIILGDLNVACGQSANPV